MPKLKGRKVWYKRAPTVQNTAPRQQCCVVCYTAFQPYSVTASRWESNMTKVFYKAMNIPPFQTGGDEEGDEDDVLLSLPYCPECHSKISVMFNLYTQLEMLQNQYACVRNEIAFIVVETIGRNNSRGPMDFIRQQIYEKWKEFYMEETSRGDYHEVLGLDALIAGNPFDLKEMFAETVEEVEEDDEEDEFKQELQQQQEEQSKRRRKRRQTSEGEHFQHASDMMELEFKENMDSDNEMDALAPNAVHVMQDSFVGDDSFQSGTFEIDGKRRRGRPRASTNGGHPPPQLIPMKQRGFKRGSFGQQRGGRGGAGAFGGHHFLADTTMDEDGLNETAGSEDTLNNQNDYDEGIEGEDYREGATSRRRALPQLTLRADADGEDGMDTKANLRYPKRNVAGRALRSSQIKQEVDESYEGLSESIGDESLGDGIPTEQFPPNTPGIFSCRLCPKFYSNSGRLLRHESLCHPSLKSIHCETCGKGFSSRLTYRRHCGQAHPEVTEGSVKCPVCQKTFLRKYSLEIHMKTHRGRVKGGMRKPRALASAGDMQNSNSLLLRTMENGEASNSSTASTPRKYLSSSPEKSLPAEADGDDGLTCGICKKRFAYKTLLNVHFLTHARKNYKCETCNAVFSSFTEMKAHSDEAHGRKTLKCPICDETFTAVEQLQRHRKTHDLKAVKQEVPEPAPETENHENQDQSLEEMTSSATPATSSQE